MNKAMAFAAVRSFTWKRGMLRCRLAGKEAQMKRRSSEAGESSG
jgi:hypothetical protein